MTKEEVDALYEHHRVAMAAERQAWVQWNRVCTEVRHVASLVPHEGRVSAISYNPTDEKFQVNVEVYAGEGHWEAPDEDWVFYIPVEYLSMTPEQIKAKVEEDRVAKEAFRLAEEAEEEAKEKAQQEITYRQLYEELKARFDP